MPSTNTDRLDGLSTSVAVKSPCKAVATTNITLSGEQTIGGVACVSGDRVLVIGQTSSIDNGIWVVSAGSWSRAKDFDGARDATQGTLVTVYRASGLSPMYRLTTSSPVIGTSALAFEEVMVSADILENQLATDDSTSLGAALIGYRGRTVYQRLDDYLNVKVFGAAGADADYSSELSTAITAAVGKRLYWNGGTYQTDPIAVPSNSHWIFDNKAILKATTGYGANDCLLDFDGASNVVLECNDALFQMLKAEYTTGEFRHLFNLVNCTDVLIKNPNGKDSGGDIYYINGATRLTIENPKGDNARRNTCSVIKATDLSVTGVAKFKGSTGTAPESGLVIEPNSDADSLIRVNFETVEVSGMDADGVSIYLDDYKTGTPSDVSITINKIISRGNGGRACRIANVFLNSGSYGGLIDIGEIVSDGDAKSALSIADKAVAAPFLKIGKVTAWDPCTGATALEDTAAVYLEDTSAAASGGIHIDTISVKSTHTDMDYGVLCEMGQGFTDVRINIENVKGYQVAPLRQNNINSTIADASDMTIDVSKLIDTVAITTGTNIVATAHLGRIVTNLGAGAGLTAALQSYPTRTPYRFRVEAAQNLIIDPLDASDRIVGTTTAGASVQSNVIGAECEVYYMGTIASVRYWKLNPIGPSASWTFN